MFKKNLLLVFSLVGAYTLAQDCPVINAPAPGSTNIPVDVTISWPAVSGIIGYSLTLGSFPGGEDILTRRSAGLTNSFVAPTGLPESTRIYVTISMFLGDGRFIFCTEEMFFETENVTTPPPCTSLAVPANGDINVDNTARISWNYAPTATGYRLSLGTSPGGSELLDGEDVGNVLEYRPQNLPPDTPVYVRIQPYNENGDAGICTEERFTTGSGTINCGPFRDPINGQTVLYSPELQFPDRVGICLDNLPTRVSATEAADGYRWYRINDDNSQTLLSESAEVFLSETGLYRYEAYNNISQLNSTFECAESRIFTVIASELPEITAIEREDLGETSDITVVVAGNGVYEFALDNEAGPYQESPAFTAVPKGVHTVYVRDRNGCGIREEPFSLGLPREAFPKFFTPNGDGINDYWQFDPPPQYSGIRLQSIHIFDRYGMLLAQIHPSGQGWDGRRNGKPLPATSYWFRARDDYDNEISGFFALKR